MQLIIILILVVNAIIFSLDHFYLSHMDETKNVGVYVFAIYNVLIMSYLIYSYITEANAAAAAAVVPAGLLSSIPGAEGIANSDILQSLIKYVQENPAILKSLSGLV